MRPYTHTSSAGAMIVEAERCPVECDDWDGTVNIALIDPRGNRAVHTMPAKAAVQMARYIQRAVGEGR